MSYSVPSSAKPFTLNIPDQEISDFKQLLKLSKLGPDTYEGRQQDRRFGITHEWLTNAKDHWLNKYDWRAQEKHINSFPNYTMEIEGMNHHFIGLFSEKKDAIPIIFLHGWPGSFIEFLPMLGLLREKYSAKDLPYHIVVASLTGYPLSEGGPLDEDWDKDQTARIMDILMNNLGFSKYVAQGGDVGSFVATALGAHYESCVAVHLNMIVGPPPDASTLSEQEQKHVQRYQRWLDNGNAYAREHGTRPSTIGHVLSSSPLALLAWIGEKMLEWSDADPPLDTILTNVSLYWFTSAFPRSIYPYRESFSGSGARKGSPYISKPFGFSYFPQEIFPGFKSVAEKAGDLVFYKKHEQGGHFAALERPEELLGDVEEFVGIAWKGKVSAAETKL